MRSDMEHFKKLTMGSVIIMGRKTLDSIGVALPGRKTIMLSRGEKSHIPGIKTAHSLDEAYSIASQLEFDSKDGSKDVFVVGGGEIYNQALADVDRIYATEVDTTVDNADTYFPKLDSNWQITTVQQLKADSNNKFPYSFITYEKK